MIDSVRTTVLSILNKNNYGYVPPMDMNLYFKMAQLDLFEEMFLTHNKLVIAQNDDKVSMDYSDRIKQVESTIEIFRRDGVDLSQDAGNVFFLPSIATTGDEFFKIESILCYQNGSILGEAEKVSEGAHQRMEMTTGSSATTSFPRYTEASGKITVYPSSFSNNGDIKASYIRYPKDPKWTYRTISGGEPMFDQSQPDYQDFELPKEYEPDLIKRVLVLSGMSIREAQAVSFADREEMKDKQEQAL